MYRFTKKNLLMPNRYEFMAIISLMHLIYLIMMGPVIWVDAASYINISHALSSFPSIAGILEGPVLWWHNYVPIGLPLLWNGLSLLPISVIWPTLAVGQHLLAILALIFCLKNLYSMQPSRWYGAAGIILCALPFYQAMHNAYMTESISSSIFLFCMGFAVKIIYTKKMDSRSCCGLLLGIFLASQFRGATGIMCLVLGVIALAQIKNLFSKALFGFIAALIIGALIFPTARYLHGGEFITPRSAPSKLFTALYANPAPSQNALDAFHTYQWPGDVTPEDIIENGASFDQINSMLQHWVGLGATDNEAMTKIEELGSIIMGDGLYPRINSIGYGLSASGMNAYLVLIPEDHIMFRGFSNKELYRHQYNYYKLFSNVKGNRAYFDHLLEVFFQSEESTELHKIFSKSMKFHYKQPSSKLYSAITIIAHIPLDLLFIIGTVTSVLLIRAKFILGLMTITIIFSNITLAASVPFADIRYSYILLPVFVISIGSFFAYRRPNQHFYRK